MTHLLDTNVCVAYLRGSSPSLLDAFQIHDSGDLAICATVRSELIYGALRSKEPVSAEAHVRRFLAPYPSLPFDESMADLSARIRARLASTGSKIGPYDLQIAATALLYKLTLVTHNTREFSRIEGLLIEDWE